MSLKIKRKEVDAFLECNRFSNMSFAEYSDRMNSLSRNRIRSIYKEVFDKECTCNTTWAKYQISYELARQADIKNKRYDRLQPNSAFRKAYKAVMQFDLEHVGDTLQTLIPFEMKYNDENSEEYKMKKEQKIKAVKKAAEAAKAARPIGLRLKKTVIETWAYVLANNDKTKYTDEQISEFMHKEFPDLKNKTFDQVNACRSHYNCGWYTKGIKPEKRSIRYDKDGNPYKAPRKSAKQPAKADIPAKPKKASVKIKKASK